MSTKAKQAKCSCPICGGNAVDGYAPFCSKRCADVDLHRWLNGAYAIPAVEADDEVSDEGETRQNLH